MAQRRDDPAFSQLYARFDLGLVARLVGSRRNHAHAVVHGHLLIRGVQVGIVAAGFRHAGLGVVGHHQLRNALIELESPHVCADPACQLLVAGGLGVGVGAGSQYRDEQMRLLHGTAARVVDRDGGSRPIDEQLLAGLVFLAQHHILLPAPALVQLAETGVAIAVRVGLPVLLPEQLLGQVWMHLPLLVKLGEVRHRQHGRASPWRTAEQGSLQPLFVPILPKRPRDSGRFGSLQILVDGSEANRTTTGDLPQPQAHFKSQSQNFFGLAHGQSPGWQAILPFLGRLPAIVLSSAVGPVEINPAKPNAVPGSA